MKNVDIRIDNWRVASLCPTRDIRQLRLLDLRGPIYEILPNVPRDFPDRSGRVDMDGKDVACRDDSEFDSVY